jgi:hypothetical protein
MTVPEYIPVFVLSVYISDYLPEMDSYHGTRFSRPSGSHFSSRVRIVSNLISVPGTAITAMPGAPAGFPELNF